MKQQQFQQTHDDKQAKLQDPLKDYPKLIQFLKNKLKEASSEQQKEKLSLDLKTIRKKKT